MVKQQSKYQKWPALLALTMIMLIMTACAGGGPGRATATPLPPGDPVDQPSPVFAAPTRTTAPTATTGATNSDPVQALLATRIAEGSKPTDLPASSPTPSPTPTSVGVESLVRRALADDPLTQPTSLAIVGAGGAGFFAVPGGGLIQSLPAGVTLTVTGRSEDGAWYAGYLEDGRSGWVGTGAVRAFGDPQELKTVSESFSPAIVATMIAEAQRPVTPIPTWTASTPTPNASGTSDQAAPSPTIAPTAVAQGEAVISGSQITVIVEGANVRAGPGTDFSIVGALTQNAQAPVVGRNESADWLRIQTPQGEGWIFATLVEVSVPVTELPVSTESNPAPQENVPEEGAAQANQSQPQAAPATGLAGQLVFQERNAGTIYRYNLITGTLQSLTSGTDPAISPDGRTVAFVRGGGANSVYLIDIDGSNERQIYTGNNPRTPAWSPDGQFIVFSHITGETQCYDVGFVCLADPPPPQFNARLVGRALRNLARVDYNGNNYRDLASLNSAIAPDWHPWGIVYQSDAGLQITQDAPDAKTRPLLNEPRFRDPDWQPGDGRITFQSQEGTHWEIFVANADGGGVTALTRPPIGEQPNNVAPAWSPDGQWIVFLSNRGGSWGIWAMDSSGANLQRLPVDVGMDIDIDYAFQAEQAVDWGVAP